MAFSKLGLSPATLEGVRAAGYITPTPIQLRGIPLILAGRDIIGSAQTGTRKTAAFALPILTKLDRHAPSEALKALAVAARSYFVAGKGRHRDFDFCDTTHCQFLREAPEGNKIGRASCRER